MTEFAQSPQEFQDSAAQNISPKSRRAIPLELEILREIWYV